MTKNLAGIRAGLTNPWGHMFLPRYSGYHNSSGSMNPVVHGWKQGGKVGLVQSFPYWAGRSYKP
jgi:hypothetical protein